jgi:cytochrome c-type biogenesis protein CcmH/NrfF
MEFELIDLLWIVPLVLLVLCAIFGSDEAVREDMNFD